MPVSFLKRTVALRQRACFFIIASGFGAMLFTFPLEAAAAKPKPPAAPPPPAAPADPGLPKLAVLQRWSVGGVGGWDYLSFDATTKQLFVSRGSRVDVVSIDTGTIVGSIPNTQGVHGIAIANTLRRGFISNGRSNSVSEFDLDTLHVVKVVDLPAQNPDAILFDRETSQVFTFNGSSNDVTVLDSANLSVLGRITMPDKPEFAVNDGEGHIFVNIESDPGRMTVIDNHTLAVKASWNLPGCDSPTGLAIDRPNHRLFSVCDAKVMVVTDSQSGKQIASLKIGEHPDAAAYDAARGLVYSSNGDGTLTVIHQDTPDHYTVIQTLATQRGARTMTLDPSTGKVYLVTADFGPAPAPTDDQPYPRPVTLPGSFVVMVVGTP